MILSGNVQNLAVFQRDFHFGQYFLPPLLLHSSILMCLLTKIFLIYHIIWYGESAMALIARDKRVKGKYFSYFFTKHKLWVLIRSAS